MPSAIIKNEKIIVIYSSFFEIFLQNKMEGEILLKDLTTLIKKESKNKTFCYHHSQFQKN